MKQQLLLNRNSQKTNQDHTVVGSGAKNPLPTKMHDIMALDMMGLSWIFADEVFSSEVFIGGGK